MALLIYGVVNRITLVNKNVWKCQLEMFLIVFEIWMFYCKFIYIKEYQTVGRMLHEIFLVAMNRPKFQTMIYDEVTNDQYGLTARSITSD